VGGATAAAAKAIENKYQQSELRRAAYIKAIRAKANDEIRKVEEVAFINSLNNEGRKADLQQRLEEGELSAICLHHLIAVVLDLTALGLAPAARSVGCRLHMQPANHALLPNLMTRCMSCNPYTQQARPVVSRRWL